MPLLASMYECMYECMYVCMYVRTYVRMFVCFSFVPRSKLLIALCEYNVEFFNVKYGDYESQQEALKS